MWDDGADRPVFALIISRRAGRLGCGDASPTKKVEGK